MAKRGEILRPCSNDWDAMAGDGAIRFCADCQKYVHDISGLSDDAAAAFIGQCVRRQPPPPPQLSPRRRFLLWASAIAAAMPVFGQSAPAFRLVVIDAAGMKITQALVRIQPAVATQKTFQLKTDDSGVVELAELPIGEYALTVESPGFTPFRETVRIEKAKINRQVQLQVGTVGGLVEIESVPVPLPAQRPPAELPPLRVRNLDRFIPKPKN